MALRLEDIAHLLATRGVNQYGREAVSQLEHALQCAQWAEKSGETPATVAAALLHDLGHLLAPDGDAAQRDDLHQYVPIPFLRGLLPDAVLEPIRLHVDAKRYLCAMEPSYWATLSPASQHSLVLQGGPFTPDEALRFAAQPFAQEACACAAMTTWPRCPACPRRRWTTTWRCCRVWRWPVRQQVWRPPWPLRRSQPRCRRGEGFGVSRPWGRSPSPGRAGGPRTRC